MNRLLLSETLLFAITVCCFSQTVADDWPIWRGPNRNNVAAGNQAPPTKWDENTNIIWKSKVPGLGHSSPIIVDGKIFLSTAETKSKIQSVICFDQQSGDQLWQTKVNEGGFEERIHNNNTHASPTIVANNNRLYVVFNNNRSIQLAALNFDGKLIWKKSTGAFIPKFRFGFGSSPCLYENLIIVMSDYPQDGYIAAFDQEDGREVWRTKRGKTSSYASPVIVTVGGNDQLVVSGTDVSSYDPATGKELWSVDGPWAVTCGTPTWEGNTIFVSGGYPTPATIAISTADKNIIWKNQIKAYEQSLLVHDGYVYCHSDSGAAYCWRTSDGKEMWKARVTGPGVSASPVLVGDKIYMTAQNGEAVVIKANPKKFEEIARNELGGAAFATPAFVDNRIYTRVGDRKGVEPQYLYCIGEK